MRRYVRSTPLPAAVGEAFAWHDRPGALERLSPPFVPGRVERRSGGLEPGSEVVLPLDVGPLRGRLAPRWIARHTVYEPPADPVSGRGEFVDVQARGPFASWTHRHRFEPDGRGRSVLIDDVAYRLPLGRLGELVGGPFVRRRLSRMFAHRHRVTAGDLAAHAAAGAKGVTPMHIAVTGSTGLIGEALIAYLTTGGHTVTRIVRRPREGAITWDPDAGGIDPEDLRGLDGVVHLAGEPIASGRWTTAQKRRIHRSRAEGTRILAEAIAALGDDAPAVLVSASGINFYGDGGDEELSEDHPPGDDFLARVCVDWEAATRAAQKAGVRVVNVRTGIVQSRQGGALAKQLPLFKAGIGGRLGRGDQWMAWVSLDDVVGLYHHALTTPEVQGPLNATGPAPVTNAAYTRILGRVLRRPTVLPIPRFGPRLVLGREMADLLLFASLRVVPTLAERTGYTFRHPTLEGCLRAVLGRPEDPA
ncbi:TIGR01777 family protein [Egibacter rhizosphaerae]|uniref:TIGR01777 family protein n=1 Tax=Egibacter rhizosphaerae TaxID=1670831 RepID=A0A411YKT6_9ACTN|nr:TIGR01777 family oxidoreductase [Egibacter rhizosphaerae]QBI21796.1 TIGR01777 family protein [Egibacter rhizosphaerae]